MNVLQTSTSILSQIGAHPFLTLFSLVLTRAIYNLYFHPLAKIPGPRLAAVSNLWRVAGACKKDYTTRLRDVHAKYGPVVRIATNEVSIVAPEEIKNLYSHHSEFVKGPFYSAFKTSRIENLFSERNVAAHALARRQSSSAYSTINVRSLETACDNSVETLLSKYFDEAAKSGDKIDLGSWIKWFSYDSIAEISFGRTYGLLRNGGDKTGFLDDMEAGGFLLAAVACFHSFGWIIASVPVQRFLAWSQPDKGLAAFVKQSSIFLQERYNLMVRDPAAYHENKDMLYRFIESRDPITSARADFEFVLTSANVVVMAGGDTTMISINAALRYVYSAPAVLQKLRMEIEHALESGNLSFPCPSYDEVIRLDYLQAVIKESLRLHPAVSMPMQRIVPKNGRVVAGHYLPAGTVVGMSPWLAHYSLDAYGLDAAEFRPERWLEGDRHELQKYNLSFGQGSRVCIGKTISIMEMSKLLPQIFHSYDIKFSNKEQPYQIQSSWFSPQHSFYASLSKRDTLL